MTNRIAVPAQLPAFPLIDQWAAHMAALSRSERTISERRRVLYEVATFAGVQPDDLTARQILDWLASKPGLKPNSTATLLGALRAWFKWLDLQDLRSMTRPARSAV